MSPSNDSAARVCDPLFRPIEDLFGNCNLLEEDRDRLPPNLTPEAEAEVDALLLKSGLISTYAKEQVKDEDISRLTPGRWLNDEIINFYGALILGRSEHCRENPLEHSKFKDQKPLNIHYFNTFFWSKLKKEGYDKGHLDRATKIDIFSKDVILIPLNHHNTHWTAAVINFREKRIESYDSTLGDSSTIFKLLRQYLDHEHRKKKNVPFDFTDWKDYISKDIPSQENGSDCGVFTCQFLESLSRGQEHFNFTQKDMLYLCRQMIWEIGNATLCNKQ
ncbi:hypothetical protein C8F01DRAFT_995404 [Mycena amicta]|nr:hypothetical protein C8F01DRAFT_995404 [Mycena amicta]